MTPAQEQKLDEVHTAIITLNQVICGDNGLQTQVKDCTTRIRDIENALNISRGKVLAITTIATSGGLVGAALTWALNHQK